MVNGKGCLIVNMFLDYRCIYWFLKTVLINNTARICPPNFNVIVKHFLEIIGQTIYCSTTYTALALIAFLYRTSIFAVLELIFFLNT